METIYKENIKNKRLLTNYGISPEWYEIKIVEQKNKCAICGSEDPHSPWKIFAIDHCHATGKVRGLLCHKCNTGLGQFRDNPQLLTKAADYLIKHQAQNAEIGRIGTAPAEMGGVTTQGMKQ